MVRPKAPEVETASRFKEAGISNREIARRMAVCEKSVRKLPKGMGWLRHFDAAFGSWLRPMLGALPPFDT
jgi:hypothetical protein